MGFESSITIYRKYKDHKISAGFQDDLYQAYAKYNKAHAYCSDELTDVDARRNQPIVFDRHINDVNTEKTGIDFYRNRYFIDGYPCDEVMRFDFISDFSELCDEYRMGSGGTWKDNERIISKDDCKQILVALKYLLNGEYSDKMEEVLDNKWIDIFGQHYPKYSTPENNEYIIEKIERGQYSIHKGDMYEDNLRKFENQSREHLFRRIALAMELALSEDYHSYSTELVVVYSISY